MKKTLFTILAIILTVTLGTQVVKAIGSLTPSGTAGDATQYTLNDIYTKLTTNNGTSTKSGSFTAPESVSATFRTLTEIYNAIPTIDAAKVATGTTYLGVTGTLQGLPAPLIWQTDPGLSICWSGSQYEIDNSCTIGNGGLTAEGYGAVEYCQNLVAEGSSDWRLPTAAEYNSIVDFSTDTPATQVSGFSLGDDYWTSTLRSDDSQFAWYWSVNSGYVETTARYYSTYKVRCVR